MQLLLLKCLAILGMIRLVRDLSALLWLWVFRSDAPPNARSVQFLLEVFVVLILGYLITTIPEDLLVAGIE